MRKEATIEQWKELYESATRLKSMKPWETFWDLDIIAEKRKTPYFTVFSVMAERVTEFPSTKDMRHLTHS